MSELLALSLDVTAVPARPAGAGRYTIDLVRALSRREDVALTLWSRRDDGPRWRAPALEPEPTRGGAPAPMAVPAPGRPRPLTVRALAPTSRPLRLAWEQVGLPRLLRGASVAVHHGPHYTMPGRAPVPTVVTVHDLTFFDHPEWHERGKVAVFRRAIRVAARRADAIVCVSAHTAQRFQELCAPAGHVVVVPHGVDLGRFSADDAETDDATLARLGVRAPYAVFVGTLEPRKAVPVLVAAFDAVADRRADLTLVLVGGPGWGGDEVRRAVASARHGDRVLRPGYVPDEAVPALLRRAAAAAYPALEEGFGLPALEALACGAPLVTTQGTAMAEVAGEAALLVRPGSVPDLADAIDAVVAGGPEVEARRRRGLEVAARHTWDASAAGHMDAYRWALSHPLRAGRGAHRTDR